MTIILQTVKLINELSLLSFSYMISPACYRVAAHFVSKVQSKAHLYLRWCMKYVYKYPTNSKPTALTKIENYCYRTIHSSSGTWTSWRLWRNLSPDSIFFIIIFTHCSFKRQASSICFWSIFSYPKKAVIHIWTVPTEKPAKHFNR